jgi:uncharacterized membrane protein
MVPMVELNGAIPWAYYKEGLDIWTSSFLGVVGNILPIPLIIWLLRYIMKFMERFRVFAKILDWLNAKGKKAAAEIQKYETWGLFLYVALPGPGTGAWTGALVASLFRMRFKSAFLSIAGGVLVNGIIIALLVYFGFDWVLEKFHLIDKV